MNFSDFLSDPSNAGMLGLSAGLLQASGPSPYKMPFGSILGQGMVSGMQTAQSARQNQLQQGLLAQQLKRAILQGNILDQLSGQYAQPQTQMVQQQPALAPSMPQAALSQGAAQGSVGPTNQNAALLQGMQQQPQAQPQPQAPQPAGSAPTSYFNPPNQYRQGLLATFAGLPGGAGMMDTALKYDPAIAQQVALAQKGYQQAPGGGFQLAPGFAGGQGEIAAAQAGAKFPFEAVTSALRGVTRPTILGTGQTAQSNFPLLPPFLQNNITRALGGQSGQAPSGNAPPVTQLAGPSPFVVESNKARAGELEKLYGNWQTEANSAQQDNLLIDRMKAESQGFSPGKLAEQYGNVQAYLQRIPGMDTPERRAMLGDYQAFQKNATQLSTSAARTMGAREPGSVIAMFKNAYPNAELTSNALNAMFTQIQGLNDYKTSRQSAADQWRGTHDGTLGGFQSAWNKTSDPMFFVVQRMPPEVRQQFFSKMSSTERQSFGMKYQSAINSGFLQPAQ